MEDIRIGRILRALRVRRGWTQSELADRAGMSQTMVSLAERGHLDAASVRTLRKLFAALDARYEGVVSWRGGALDRLVDERHAALVGASADALPQAVWESRLEVTFSEYGERGSIDLLAFSAATSHLGVEEMKTEITSIEETVRRHDVKTRLAARVAEERFGWHASTVSRVLVVLDTSTNRRRVERHAATLGRAYPDRGASVRAWLRQPTHRVDGLIFLSTSNPRAERRLIRAGVPPRR